MYYLYDDFFTDEYCSTKKEEVITYLSNGKFKFEIYCIMYSVNDKNLFDIININELHFGYYKKMDLYILGFAKGRGSAVNVVVQIIERVLEKYTIDDIRNFYDRKDFYML